MKKLLYILFIIGLLGINHSYAADANTVDNQLLNLEDQSKAEDLKVNFNLQNFSSCQNLEDVVGKYIKNYSNFYPNRYFYKGGIDFALDDSVAIPTAGAVQKEASNSVAGGTVNIDPSKSATDFSQTNIQVGGVDESEIVKTDGKFIYYYNSKTHSINIVRSYPAKDMEIVKTIKVPDSFNDTELYINGKKLTIVANKYSNNSYGYYWFNRNAKTVVVTYDISDLTKLKIDKFYQVDGTVSKSRKIGKYVYVLSQSNFNFPYVNYYGPMVKSSASSTLDINKVDSDMDAKRLLPLKAELKVASNSTEQNVNVKGTDVKYNLTQGYTSKCTDIEFVMPDEATLKKFDFTPSYVTLSIINTEDATESVASKLLFGDVNEVYMSLTNLYITSNMYTTNNFKCTSMGCMMPYYNAGEQTLIHKLSLNGKEVKYLSSTVVPGSPLNQYSMDENSDGYFRIVTSSFSPTRSTNVFVLDKNLKLTGKLEGLGKDENFQSSRFIGNKLYLVTFKQIDPLFVIDLSNNTNPKLLGELIMPGYSTYLHPYDENHLIGIGYDTKTNQWGGTQNAGIKVDLYDVSDIKNPKQQYTLTIGDQSSYADVLNNPRLFTWNAKEKILFMPATLYTNAGDKTNTYRSSDVFQGSVAIKIDETSGIKELSRVTHIDTTGLDEKRKEECAKYQVETTPKCVKIIGGGEYCPASTAYIPTYCYEGSTTGEYLANQIWNYNDQFVLRNLYLDNLWFTISNTKIQVNDIKNSFNKIDEVKMK